MKIRLVIPSLILTIACLWFACNKTTPNSNTLSTGSFSFQSSKCIGYALSKGNSNDSIFTYSFTDMLLIDFSVIANCCPDSNRFTVSKAAGSDTIIIAVVDTAESKCWCVCRYMIHVEFNELQNNHYVVCCTISDSQIEAPPEIIHKVNVYRND